MSKKIVYENEEFNLLQAALNIEDSIEDLRYNNIVIATEEEMVEAIKFAHESIKIQCKAQEKLAKAFGKKETREYDPRKIYIFKMSSWS